MHKLCTEMLAGLPPAWPDIRDAWSRLFPLLTQLESTPQDPTWHGEGNVSIHTGMVLQCVRNVIAGNSDIDAATALILQLGAVFHDIGKPLTTRTKEIHGQERIISPHHASAGRNYLCLRLQALELSPEVESAVLAIVAFHHHPRRLVQDDAPSARWRQLARQCNVRHLYWIELADLHGRHCPDLDDQLEIIELFRLRCEELELWGNDDPWADWRREISSAFASRSQAFRDHAFDAAVMDAESGTIQSVEEAIARAYQLKDPAASLTLLWGPSGSGKSEWIDRQADGAQVISLDALREEIAGNREDQSMNGQVLQAAKERLKAAFRKGERVIFDATNLRRELRGSTLQLGIDYGAHTRILALQTPLTTLQNRNKKRQHPVRESVLQRQLEMLEWPELDEAHRVEIVRQA